MCDFEESLTLWSGAAIVTNAGVTSAEKRRNEGDGERRSMEATISGYDDGLIETPKAYCLLETSARRSVKAEK